MPGGTAKSSGAAVVALAAICSRRSISRTFSVKPSRRERSGALISVRRPAILPLIESRMLWLRSRRATRCSGVLPLPNMRSNTTCGFNSIGNGVVGDAQAIVFVYTQL